MTHISRDAWRSYIHAILRHTLLAALMFAMGSHLSSVKAQINTPVPEAEYHFSRLSIEQGLIDNEVQTILQDRAGFIWIGTSQGLTKYDGARHINFHNNVKRPDSLSSNIISALYQDHQSRLWVGTENGLNRQVNHNDEFIRFVHDPESSTSLIDNHIVDILQDSDNNIWVATETGVHLFDNQTEKFTRFTFFEPTTTEQLTVNWLLMHADKLFVGTTYGLFEYRQADKAFYRYSEAEGLPAILSDVSSGGLDSTGQLWVSIRDVGIFKKPVGESVFVNESSLSRLLQQPGLVVSEITSPNGFDDLWLGTQNHGLYRYDQENKNLLRVIQSNKNAFNAFKNSRIFKIVSDQSGLVWVTTEQAGIFQWSKHTLNIEHIAAIENRDTEEYLTSYIWYFHQTRPDEVWIGSQRGLARFNPKNFSYEQITLDLSDSQSQPNIYWMESRDDNLWLATEIGLLSYDKKENTITSRVAPISETNQYYAVTATENYLFIAINELGIMAFDIESGQHLSFSITVGRENADLVSSPVGIVRDLDNSIWILTRDRLINFHPETDTVRLNLAAGPEALSGNRISSLFQVDENTYWVGTVGNGINRLTVNDINTGDFEVEQFDDNPQLANIVATGILVDDRSNSNVWISTHSGLILFNPQTGFTRKFASSDGIQSREFNEGAYMKGMDGQLYFGGVNGFNLIEPFGFTQSKYQPQLRISSFNITCDENDSSCQAAEKKFQEDITCNQYFDSCQLVDNRLPSTLESVKISFASLDYTSPEINQYRYRYLSGGSENWNSLGTTTELTISGLDSGFISLEIQGTNFTGEWSDRSIIFDFEVETPWYLKNYTLIILVMALATTAYFYRESLVLKALEQERISKAIRKNEENFKFALWGSGDEIWDWDITSDHIERTNPIQQVEVKDSSEALSMSTVLALIHPEDAPRVNDEVIQVFKADKPFLESIFRFKSKGGGFLWVLARARVVERDARGQAIRALGSLKDITLMKATEDKLNLIAQAFENTKDGISVVDAEFKAVFNNKAFYEITGLTHIDALHNQYFFAEGSDNHDMYNQVKIALKNFGEWEGEIWERRPGGEEFAISLKIDVVHDQPTSEQYYICVFSDVTYRKRSEEELIKLANIDSLTGLPNRSLFLDRLAHAIAYSRRNKTMFALLFIDLDNFKNINDTLGHTIGDKMLINIAKRLKGCVRDVDTVARLGGDEFTVILENINTTNEVGVCANKILSKLSESMEIEAIQLKSTPSIGIGMYPAHGKDQESILKNADLAMYSAKEKGKNNYQFFTEDMTSLAMERINIENKLREAIDDNQLQLYYQPKVYSMTGEITGFEALIRWIHPEDGMISPGAFIPVAEETGLILSLGDWILEDAIKQAKIWSEINPDAAQIAINISAKQFMSEFLPERIAALLEQYELHPKFLELEITEGTLIENMHHTVQALNKLRDMGLMISLDDFGTGYSSLSYLKQFPVNKLKVDQSFVRDITTDPSDASIVASIITLAHNLGLNVVAEGCETFEQLSFIRSYHCEQVQGYLFSRPLPKDEATDLLRIGRIEIKEDS